MLKPPSGGNASGGGTVASGGTGTTQTGRKQGTGLADKLNPSSADSLPLPLLVLGALAILLVAAGGAGLLAKRYQGRKPST